MPRYYRLPCAEARSFIGSGVKGIVYLLHFDRPYPQRRGQRTVLVWHYIGWVKDIRQLPVRLQEHRSGRGARLLAAVSAVGIHWHVVALFRGADRHFERWLHNRADTPT